MKKKLMYEVPDAELIELKLEGYLMQSGRYGEEGAAGGNVTSGGEFDFDDEG